MISLQQEEIFLQIIQSKINHKVINLDFSTIKQVKQVRQVRQDKQDKQDKLTLDKLDKLAYLITMLISLTPIQILIKNLQEFSLPTNQPKQ